MSWLPCPDPIPGDSRTCNSIETVLLPRMRDIGGFEVGRVLPALGQGMVGPFIFFDQMGPAIFSSQKGLDVLPHPHINLATVTYLFEGEITHRDSLGTEKIIRPGAVNWMSAGRGIVHSERSDDKARQDGGRLFGLQTWVALPENVEESEPWFSHVGKEKLPFIEDGGAQARLIVGNNWGKKSPVSTPSDTLYADVALQPQSQLPIDTAHEERAVYTVSGAVEIDGKTFGPNQLLILRPDCPITVYNRGANPARFILIGGETMDGPRYIWWNFVSSNKERISQAQAEWKSGRFDSVPGDAEEFTPLPNTQIGNPRRIPTR